MKIEHQDILEQIKNKRIGDVTFSRYDLATGIESKQQQQFILKEALQFLLLCHQSHLETIFASHEPQQQIYLVTMQFQDQSLSNLFIDGSPVNQQKFVKKIEIVGTNSLYQFHSADERGFSSNFILPGNYFPDYDEASLDNIWLSNLVYQIHDSMNQKKIIHLGGETT
ncbi:hypothetical protein ACYSNO_11840 [Enterococcus sp. LJL98]